MSNPTIKVFNLNNSASFSVKFDQGVKITNYSKEKYSPNDDESKLNELDSGYFIAEVSEKGNSIHKRTSKGISNNLGTLDLRSQRYNVFDELRKLDGDESNISAKDLQLARSQLVGKHGVKRVASDPNAGITTFYFEDGNVLRFDFETESEKNIQNTQETKPLAYPEEPKKPERKAIVTHVVDYGETLSGIAEKYNSTVTLIRAANDMVSGGSVINPGQKLKVPTYTKEDEAKYKKALEQYEKDLVAYYENQRQEELKHSIEVGQKGIEKAEEYYLNEYYIEQQTDENGNKTGRVIITVEDTKKLGKIREELGIPAGVLTFFNPELKEEALQEIGDSGSYTRDLQKVYPGETLVIPGEYLNPKEPNAVMKFIKKYL